MWLDMNEPSNFGTNEEKPWNWQQPDPWSLKCPEGDPLEDPPYKPLAARPYRSNGRLSDKTICMMTLQGENEEFAHYDVHSLYGWSQAEPTLKYFSLFLFFVFVFISLDRLDFKRISNCFI